MSRDYLSFDEFNRRSATPPTHTTPAALALAALAGLYTLVRLLDVLGYPVWPWICRRAHAMAVDVLRAVSPTPSLDSHASADSAHSGGMMGTLFGMGASALSKGVRGVASALSRASSDLPPGLGNLDNSCYQNSVIQGLASLPALRRYLDDAHAAHDALTPDTTNAALLDLLAQLNDPAHRGHHFWVRGKLKSMSTFTQQDAQEYYSRILDELDKELRAATNAATTDTNPIPLEGALAQRVGCTTCGYSEGLSLIPFNCITVSLGRRNAYHIRHLLDDHTDLEYIQGVECSKCTLLKLKRTLVPVVDKQGHDSPFAARLRLVQDALDDQDLKDSTLIKTLNIPKKNWVKSEKSKQVVIARAPKALVLHVNRSIFDESTFAQYKNNAGVSYPSTLDLGRWCLGAAPSRTQKPDLDPKTDDWPRDPNKSMLADAPDTPSPFQYRLRAAVTHFGTHGNGHYVCYRPHPRLRRDESKQGDVESDHGHDEHEDEVVSKHGDDEREDEVESKHGDDERKDEVESKEHADDVESTEHEDEVDTKEYEDEVDTKEHEDDVGSNQHDADDAQEQWYRFSDDTVYAVSEEEAHQGNVFMLFYERIDEPSSPSEPSTPVEPLAMTADAPTDVLTADVPTAEPLEAATTPLPKADTADAFIPPEPTPHAKPPTTASDKSAPTDADASETDLDSEAEPQLPPTPTLPKLSPHTMRTAGNASSRNSGSRASLPLVSAT